MFVFAALVSDGDGSDMSVSQNPAIDRIIPNRGDEVLQQQTVGIDLAPLIAGAGVLGVAIGFGAQDIVKDFLSGVLMLIEDQYGVGDVI
ncbi:MAG: hypothetical protein EBY65_07865, partial [Acidimicrobiia bacterium]|nr:hypothetical protein [Acidimicrobiia bacterium]